MRFLLGAVMGVGLVLSGQSPANALIFGRCGDGKIRPLVEQCDGANLGGASCQSRGFNSGTLACTATCKLDTSGCNTIQEDLGTCQTDLAACEAEPVFAFPASGQTTAFTANKNDGNPAAVPVPDDGTIQAGAPLSYTDTGNGTITDNNTGLIWEKKSDDGGLHDKDNAYRWSGDGSQETIWDWLADLNAEGGTGFAGHGDWRISNAKELQSIVDYQRANPTIDPVFNTGCVAACTVLTCSCTVSSNYWSATTFAFDPTFAWDVFFNVGLVNGTNKSLNLFVRAVRGGS